MGVLVEIFQTQNLNLYLFKIRLVQILSVEIKEHIQFYCSDFVGSNSFFAKMNASEGADNAYVVVVAKKCRNIRKK